MAFDVVITKVAEDDFDEAISHIAVVLKNPIAASALADDYEEALRQISDNPFLFHHFEIMKETTHLIVDTISEIIPYFTEWKEQGSLSADFYIQNVIYSTYRWK